MNGQETEYVFFYEDSTRYDVVQIKKADPEGKEVLEIKEMKVYTQPGKLPFKTIWNRCRI